MDIIPFHPFNDCATHLVTVPHHREILRKYSPSNALLVKSQDHPETQRAKMTLNAPPTVTFATSEEAIATVRAFARSESYEVKIGRSVKISNRKEGEVKRIHLICAHGKKHILKETRIRRTTTGCTDCTF